MEDWLTAYRLPIGDWIEELVDLLIEVLIENGAAPPDSVDLPPDPWPAD